MRFSYAVPLVLGGVLTSTQTIAPTYAEPLRAGGYWSVRQLRNKIRRTESVLDKIDGDTLERSRMCCG